MISDKCLPKTFATDLLQVINMGMLEICGVSLGCLIRLGDRMWLLTVCLTTKRTSHSVLIGETRTSCKTGKL